MIDVLLDSFSEQHKDVVVEETIVDFTRCFYEGTHYTGPHSYDSGPVYGFVIRGAPLLSKYEIDKGLVRKDGKTKIKSFGDLEKTLSMHCTNYLRSTTFHEIYDALEHTNTIQGYTKNHLDNIVSSIDDFTVEKDTVFLYGGEEADKKAKLGQIWFSQMLDYGSDSTKAMTLKEALLISHLFPKEVKMGVDLSRAGYMPGTNLYTKESTEFIRRKMERFQTYKKQLIVDTGGGVTGSILIGAPLVDYVVSGLRSFEGIAAARGSTIPVNASVSGIYGKIRESTYTWFNANEHSHWLRKGLADFTALTIVQAPVYLISVVSGQLAEMGDIDLEKIMWGLAKFEALGLPISWLLGKYMDGFRNLFHMQKPSELIAKKRGWRS